MASISRVEVFQIDKDEISRLWRCWGRLTASISDHESEDFNRVDAHFLDLLKLLDDPLEQRLSIIENYMQSDTRND